MAKKTKNISYKFVLESHFTSISGLGGSILSNKVKIVVPSCTQQRTYVLMCWFLSRKLKSCYGARNWFQEPSLELSSEATFAGGPVHLWLCTLSHVSECKTYCAAHVCTLFSSTVNACWPPVIFKLCKTLPLTGPGGDQLLTPSLQVFFLLQQYIYILCSIRSV